MKTLAIVALVAGATTAYADEAADLFEQGRVQKDDGDLVAACKSFEQSYDLERAAGTALNLGECEERAGNWEYALELYDGAAQVFANEGQDVRADFARKRAAKLRAAHAPKPAEQPAAPAPDAPKAKTWVLGVGLGAITLSALGTAGIVYSYSKQAEFRDATVTGDFIGPDPDQLVVTEDDCGKGEFTDRGLNSKFEAACTAERRLHWLLPATLASGVVGVTAIAYYLWTRPKQRTSSMAVLPTASGGVVAAFEW